LRGGQLRFDIHGEPNRAKPRTSQPTPKPLPTKSQTDGVTAAGAEICGAEDIRAEDIETSEPLDKSQGEPSGRADWTEDRATFRATGREKRKPPKSGSEERKKKPLEEERAEDGHRHDRSVSEPRAVSSLVKRSFPKTAEEESQGLESLRVRVRGRVSEFAEIPSIVYVCACTCAIYIHTCARGSVSSHADKSHILKPCIFETAPNHSKI